ncbi:hypothetical protein Rhe02_02330 [Rhizocola hellebori]|uniref:Uncharacterized protein n=1 Tax=Rhizocola hellebori TaxID=1392758 RepID=A0A8J3Q2I1_9ACTN|nr:hypothetical protein [Rhizocola hellebori]GIH02166.1 hypothetical protein Rhe02_02330 [Rhizocola hellebori]
MQLQLPVKLSMVEASGAGYSQTYTNIKADVEQPDALFKVPDGYHTAMPPRGTDGDMSTAFYPCAWAVNSPLVINSVGTYFASDAVTAYTTVGGGSGFPPLPNFPCIFIQDYPQFEYPLFGYPLTPLPNYLQDVWVVEDTGGFVPWIPYVAFGYIEFTTRPIHLYETTRFVGEVVLIIN